MLDIDSLYRRSVLATADAPWVKRFLERNGWRLGVGRFVAGRDVTEAVPKLQAIQAAGKRVILDVLGEFVTTEAAARVTSERILASIEVVREADVEPYFSVKPTQIGLGVAPQLALELASGIARRLAEVGGRLCLDMENSPQVDGTLELLTRLRADGHEHVGTVLQSYLHRTPADLERLLALSPAPSLRIVKGAYKEPAEIALQSKADVDAAFERLVKRGLEAGAYVAIATHDKRLLERLLAFISGAGFTDERYGVQMLYGVSPGLQDRLTAAAEPLRVYVPFGDDWYGYYSRRLAERPANLMFVLRGLFG
ncbi:MAG TPA: proline dehydrogenase family protein [Trueperaceae bacterium]|nr:proline dehydrogenase family protein [Trueperaceae bacterium]